MNGATGARRRTAVEWLAAATQDPQACLEEWRGHPLGVALLPAGHLWDVLIVTGPLGRPALDVLTRRLARPGPVLADFGDSRTGFFVPAGTAATAAAEVAARCHAAVAPVPGVRPAARGTWVVTPYPGRRTGGVRWLVIPDGCGSLTDPGTLAWAVCEAAARSAPSACHGDQRSHRR